MQPEENDTTDDLPDAISPQYLYEQASKCCQQYSALTMQVRTLAQHVLLGYAVGVGLALSKVGEWPPPYLRYVLVGAGLILTAFATVLWVLNQHYSMSFRAIRDDVLVRLERINKERSFDATPTSFGPWTAHKKERQDHKIASWFAWHLPFITLLIIGGSSILLGFLVK